MNNLEWVRACRKSYAFGKALDYYLENGAHEFVDAMAQRCVEMGVSSKMTDMCWTALINQYPRADIADIATAHGVNLEDL